MSPKIGKYSAGISVNRTEQRPQHVVETDDKNRRAERLQIFRYKTHPQFLARANDENGDEQNDEIASKAEKIGEPARAIHALVLPQALRLFKKRWIEPRKRSGPIHLLALRHLAFAFGVKRLVNDEFAF